jgi:hypothetical protein
MDKANAETTDTGQGVLAIDIGGTKSLAALVVGDKVEKQIIVPTAREDGPDAWIGPSTNLFSRGQGGGGPSQGSHPP